MVRLTRLTAGSALAQKSSLLATIRLRWRSARVASRGVARVQVRRPTRAVFDRVPQLMRVTRRIAQKLFTIPPVGSRRGTWVGASFAWHAGLAGSIRSSHPGRKRKKASWLGLGLCFKIKACILAHGWRYTWYTPYYYHFYYYYRLPSTATTDHI